QAVEEAGAKDISVTALALVDFHSPQVLDWIERTVKSPVSDRWGYLAARSCLTWAVVSRWLAAGRPLSLVAVDALLEIYCPRPSARPSAAPEILDQPQAAVVVRALRDAAQDDPVPRVEKAVAAIERQLLGNLDLA
ncbi:MAG: hypothetical protein JWM33_2426, partial [Caulobacteraceae bacterium]|nr:hypothetical protein [Caulobacteraceae bacterium]